MADQEIQQNKKPVDPTLKDLLDIMKKDIFLSLNCHHIGQIQEFDNEKQTARVTVSYKKTFFEKNAKGQYAPVLKDYPILLDCPVVVLSGGDFSIKIPIKKGDDCLVLFNDRDIDNWFRSGQVAALASPRLHSISDGIALVGINSLKSSLAGYDEDRMIIEKEGKGSIAIGDKLRLENDARNLNTVLQSILTELQTLTTNLALLTVSGVTPGAGTSAVPVNAAAITASGTQLGVLATQLGELLE